MTLKQLFASVIALSAICAFIVVAISFEFRPSPWRDITIDAIKDAKYMAAGVIYARWLWK